jgi:hypothetical protein
MEADAETATETEPSPEVAAEAGADTAEPPAQA